MKQLFYWQIKLTLVKTKMSKIKLPKKYISPSQLMLFERDPMAYYDQYFVGRIDSATPKMIFGKIFQEAWCDKKYNYKKELTDAGFTSDKIRVIKTALSHPDTIMVAKNKTEKTIKIKHQGVKDYELLCILDGLDRDVIVENKMGIWWSEKMVAESVQLTWQMMSYYIKFKKMPKLILQTFNANNGFPRIHIAKRTKKDFDDLIIRINSMITRIEAGDFEKY